MTATAPVRPFTYEHIPLLRELLPKQHGRPGFTYAQVCVTNQRRAQDQGWSPVDGTAIYTIVGPKGQVDMVLMAKGKPLRGVGHASGKRSCVVDLAVEQATGLLVKSKPLNTTQGATNGQQQPRTQTAKVAAQSRESDARVQIGEAAQR